MQRAVVVLMGGTERVANISVHTASLVSTVALSVGVASMEFATPEMGGVSVIPVIPGSVVTRVREIIT